MSRNPYENYPGGKYDPRFNPMYGNVNPPPASNTSSLSHNNVFNAQNNPNIQNPQNFNQLNSPIYGNFNNGSDHFSQGVTGANGTGVRENIYGTHAGNQIPGQAGIAYGGGNAVHNAYNQYRSQEQNYGFNNGYRGIPSYAPPPYSRNSNFTADFIGVMNGVFAYMFGGLMVTFAVALFVSLSKSFSSVVVGIWPILAIAEIGLVLGISWGIKRMSASTAGVMFGVYSVVSGLTLSCVFLAYTKTSIASAFLVTALTFGIMSAIGFFAKKDLTSLGSLCLMGLIGIILASIVNLLILRSGSLSFFITVIGLLIFIGLTAYDTQRIKNNLQNASSGSGASAEIVKKVTILGALSLYLDFINIFLKLLRLVGRSK